MLVVAVPFVGHATAGFTSTNTNTGGKTGTGSLQLAAATGSTTECATGITTPTAACTGYTLASNTLANGTSTTSLATTVKATGSLTPTATTLTQGSCGPVPLANSNMPADPMLIRGGVTNAVAGPLTGGTAMTVDGSSGYAVDVTGTSNPINITQVVWFKSTSTKGGNLLGMSNTPAVAPSNWDKMLWLDNAGKVVFGVYPNAVKIVTSPKAYNDGAWHLAAASIGSTGQLLYVDGVLVASTSSVTTAQSYLGYWHVGWENSNNGWTDGPTNPYLAGSLANAAIFPTLTATQIKRLYQAGTQATWNTYVTTTTNGPAATQSWTLGDTATDVYTDSPSWYSADPCCLVDATVQVSAAGTTCAAPARSGSCPAPTSSIILASLEGTAATLTSPTPTQGDTVTVTTARDGTNTVGKNPNLLGLHLNVTQALVATSGAFRAELDWPANQDIVL